MDKGRAINRFIERADTYNQIVLVTTGEIAELFGDELMQALTEIETTAREQRLCVDCGGKCCDDIGCELFASQFGQCPIHPFRPIACRLHFCHKFDTLYKSTIIELRDVFFGCYRTVDIDYSPNIASLDTPPFATHCPEFIVPVTRLVKAVREGNSIPRDMANLVMKEASRYRLSRAARLSDAAPK